MDLADYGWDEQWQSHLDAHNNKGLCPGRITNEHKSGYKVITEGGELEAGISGRMRHASENGDSLPAVGDWVLLQLPPGDGTALIHAILPRRSKFARKIAGYQTREQVLAANIDTTFIVAGLDRDFNPRRIERYLVMVWESGAAGVIVLNKADLCPDVTEKAAQLEGIAFGIPIYVTSAEMGWGLDQLAPYCAPSKTVALVGSSGVGKSSIVNALSRAGLQQVSSISSSTGKGRHTTSRRDLILMPGGGLVIDTPGLREFGLWSDEDGLDDQFSDIDSLSRLCRFVDCQHDTEPGCAVKKAIREGKLSMDRLESYLRLKRELAHLARRKLHKARQAKKWKVRKSQQGFEDWGGY